jgi:hypothetical protein
MTTVRFIRDLRAFQNKALVHRAFTSFALLDVFVEFGPAGL